MISVGEGGFRCAFSEEGDSGSIYRIREQQERKQKKAEREKEVRSGGRKERKWIETVGENLSKRKIQNIGKKYEADD